MSEFHSKFASAQCLENKIVHQILYIIDNGKIYVGIVTCHFLAHLYQSYGP